MIITSLATHPIKSLRPIMVPSITLTALGPLHDRRFLLLRLAQPGVKADDEILCVARYSQLCLFLQSFSPSSASPEEAEEVVVEYNPPERMPTERAKNGVLLSPERKTLGVPLHPNTQEMQTKGVNMHNSSCTAYDMGDSYFAFFSECLGFPVRLLYLGESKRKVLGNVAPKSNEASKPPTGWLSSLSMGILGGMDRNEEDEKYGIGFADCAQILVATIPSLQNVSERFLHSQDKPNGSQNGMDMSKFRPNIVVGPSPDNVAEFSAWEEDYWAALEICSPKEDIEAVTILLTQNSGRCRSINVEYETGNFGDTKNGGEEPLKYLMKDRRVDAGVKYSPIFGRYGFLASKGIIFHPISQYVV